MALAKEAMKDYRDGDTIMFIGLFHIIGLST